MGTSLILVENNDRNQLYIGTSLILVEKKNDRKQLYIGTSLILVEKTW